MLGGDFIICNALVSFDSGAKHSMTSLTERMDDIYKKKKKNRLSFGGSLAAVSLLFFILTNFKRGRRSQCKKSKKKKKNKKEKISDSYSTVLLLALTLKFILPRAFLLHKFS